MRRRDARSRLTHDRRISEYGPIVGAAALGRSGHGAPRDLDSVFAGLAHDEEVLVCSIARPIGPKVRRSGWAIVEGLRTGRVSGRRGLSQSLGQGLIVGLREMFAFVHVGRSFRASAPHVTRERSAEASSWC